MAQPSARLRGTLWGAHRLCQQLVGLTARARGAEPESRALCGCASLGLLLRQLRAATARGHANIHLLRT